MLQVGRPAVVLGSTQNGALVDRAAAARAGVEVARRRSGGGAVLVDGGLLWVEVVIPRHDPLWDDDTGRAAWWVGEAWWGAVGDLGLPLSDTSVWRGAMAGSPWSEVVCFAGRAPGELLSGEAKVVGISQRRVRAGALFQCGALLRWDPPSLLELLDLSGTDRERGAADLRSAALGLGTAGGETLVEAFLRHLPTA